MTKPVTRKMAVDCLLYRAMGHVAFVCGICNERLMPGDDIQFDHIHSDAMGGRHEYQNLRPVHYDPCHKKKSKKDVGALAKVDRLTGVTKTKPKKKIKSAGFKGSRPFPKRKK